MHVLLVQPSVSAEPAYPLALAGIIPLLEAAGHTVSGIDLCFEEVEAIDTAVDQREVDWVVATVLHHNASSVMAWMAPLKGRVQTAVAGALPTLDPHGALALTGADFAIVGPPEEALSALIDSGGRRQIDGVISRHTPDLKPRLPTPFALLPTPDRRVFPVERYSHAMRSTANPYTQVVTSRGCRRHCPYCTVPAMRPTGFDPRTPEDVVAEWTALVRDHGVKSIHVEDDSFLADPDRVRRICEGIHEAGLTVSWELVNGIRVDQVNLPLLDTMARAGCNRLVYSFEHLNPNHSPAIGHSHAEAAAAVSWARECKMRVGGYFIVGLPGESLASTIESIHLALKLRLDDANWIPFYESPGSGFAGCATSIDATTIRRSTATRLTKLATLAFFANPETFGQLWSEIAATPATLPALAEKALELLRTGGPVPLRDTP